MAPVISVSEVISVPLTQLTAVCHGQEGRRKVFRELKMSGLCNLS